MLASEQVETLICTLATWDRDTLVSEFMSFRSRFPIDVTPDFLSGLDEDQIRHLFLAVCLQNNRLPDASMDWVA